MPTSSPSPLRLSLLLAAAMLLLLPGRLVADGEDDGVAYGKDKLIIVGLDADYPPLEYVDEEGEPHGYDVEFTNILMKRMGLKFTYAPNEWENISGDVLQGHVDLAMMIYSPYRKDSTNYSRAVFRLYYQVVYRKSEEGRFSFRNLEGKHIAYMKSRPIGQMLTQEKAEGHIVTDMSKAFLDLNAGKYDALICFRYQALHFLSKYRLSDLKNEDLSLTPREYCYVSHSKPLIETINRELMLMEKEGIIDDVYGKNIKATFGSIEIPHWVWYLLASVVVGFLTVFVVVARRANKRLAAEHRKLADAYSQLAEKNEALTAATERAEESSRMKTAFIQQISHEIRTPLNILNGFAQVLTSQDMELTADEKADASRRIADNSERITNLVNKMLELSDASSMAFIERGDQTTVEAIVSQAVDEAGIARADHVSFVVDIGSGVRESHLLTNQRMASRALSLLLDNAQKFTIKGSVTLSATLAADGTSVCFSVTDTGIGINPDDAERIFDAFVQLDDNYDGTGIGLTVARSIVRRLGGDMWLDTHYAAASGTRFSMTLPVA